jgi:hypothetical protein
MKALLVHPEDPDSGPWRNQHWDRVVDLGLAGSGTYARWSRTLGCSVETSGPAHRGMADFRQMRNLLSAGDGRLVDRHGLDWWEIFSILLIEQLESVISLQRLAESIADDVVYITRPCNHASVLQTALHGRLQVFPEKPSHYFPKLARCFDLLRKLSLPQIVDVLCDKYDPGQRLRAKFSRPRRKSECPVVLIPTAYGNVSRTGIAYANTLPQQDFLLVSTRRSGWMKALPTNVAARWLSSYAVVRDRGVEVAEMEVRWRGLLRDLIELPEFKLLDSLGCFDQFLQHLRHGLEIRDAWRNVLDHEPVRAVLCADDSNPYTRIPLLLARERGLPNIACHHGALDGYYALKRTYGDVILAKGKMEQDYLVKRCGVPAENVEIGAPARPTPVKTDQNKTGVAENYRTNGRNHWTCDAFRPHILFISEPYEAGNARAEEFYRDVLPPLADIAIDAGCKLIVKLHPIESTSERRRLFKKVLAPRQTAVTHVIAGPLTDALLDTAWFGVTVLSTVATECGVRGIPCFLCKWLDYSFCGYIDQFIRFGVGIALNAPGEIMNIPQYLEKYEPNPAVQANCWEPIQAERFMVLLTSSARLCSAAAS